MGILWTACPCVHFQRHEGLHYVLHAWMHACSFSSAHLKCSIAASKFKIYSSRSLFPSGKVGMLESFCKDKYSRALRRSASIGAMEKDSIKTLNCHFWECHWWKPLVFCYLGKSWIVPQEKILNNFIEYWIKFVILFFQIIWSLN